MIEISRGESAPSSYLPPYRHPEHHPTIAGRCGRLQLFVGADRVTSPQIRHRDAVEVGTAEGSSVVTSAVTSAVASVVKSTPGEAFIAIRSGERAAGTRKRSRISWLRRSTSSCRRTISHSLSGCQMQARCLRYKAGKMPALQGRQDAYPTRQDAHATTDRDGRKGRCLGYPRIADSAFLSADRSEAESPPRRLRTRLRSTVASTGLITDG